MMLTAESFRPARYLRNGQIQTILASSPFRAWGNNPMRSFAREMILTTDQGIRLLGFHSTRQDGNARGLVVLLHGWEGSADSTYILRTGNSLYRRGYDIFRLNFRDHGDSHHLNRGIFYAVLLEEVFQAVRQVCRMAARQSVFLVGFSLGGNFALRIARRLLQTPVDNLCHAVAISPVLNPAKSTLCLDQNVLIRKYFLKKWRQSLKKKQHLFPDLYDFSDIFRLNTIQAMTDRLLDKYSDYNSAAEYFQTYSILKDAVKNLAVGTTIISAGDDPIIPVEDFYQLELSEHTRLIVPARGGHNGFIDGFFLKSWYEERLADMFDAMIKNAGRLEGHEAGKLKEHE